MNIYWRNRELPQRADGAWSTNEGEPFSCSVITADGHEFAATIAFCGVRWTKKSTSPQGAVDGAARKAGKWLHEFSATSKWLLEHGRDKLPGAKRGPYSMAKVPDSPEQAEWIERKRKERR